MDIVRVPHHELMNHDLEIIYLQDKLHFSSSVLASSPVFRSLVGAGDGQVLGVPGGEVVQTPLAAGQTRAVLTHSRALGALRRIS